MIIKAFWNVCLLFCDYEMFIAISDNGDNILHFSSFGYEMSFQSTMLMLVMTKHIC